MAAEAIDSICHLPEENRLPPRVVARKAKGGGAVCGRTPAVSAVAARDPLAAAVAAAAAVSMAANGGTTAVTRRTAHGARLRLRCRLQQHWRPLPSQPFAPAHENWRGAWTIARRGGDGQGTTPNPQRVRVPPTATRVPPPVPPHQSGTRGKGAFYDIWAAAACRAGGGAWGTPGDSPYMHNGLAGLAVPPGSPAGARMTQPQRRPPHPVAPPRRWGRCGLLARSSATYTPAAPRRR